MGSLITILAVQQIKVHPYMIQTMFEILNIFPEEKSEPFSSEFFTGKRSERFIEHCKARSVERQQKEFQKRIDDQEKYVHTLEDNLVLQKNAHDTKQVNGEQLEKYIDENRTLYRLKYDQEQIGKTWDKNDKIDLEYLFAIFQFCRGPQFHILLQCYPPADNKPVMDLCESFLEQAKGYRKSFPLHTLREFIRNKIFIDFVSKIEKLSKDKTVSNSYEKMFD
jgi:hypothetical protein